MDNTVETTVQDTTPKFEIDGKKLAINLALKVALPLVIGIGVNLAMRHFAKTNVDQN